RRDGASEAEAAAAALRLTTGVARADRPADRGSRAAAIRHPDPHEVHWLAADGRREDREAVAHATGTALGADHRVAAALQAPDRHVPRPQPGAEAEDDLGGARVEVALGGDLRPRRVAGHAQLLRRGDDEG